MSLTKSIELLQRHISDKEAEIEAYKQMIKVYQTVPLVPESELTKELMTLADIIEARS